MLLENLKENGQAPHWLTDSGFSTLRNGYLLPDETPKDMWHRVSDASAARLKKPKLAGKFFDLFWNNWLCGATPVLSNMGTKRGLPISCNSLHIGDSIDSIFMKQHELAMLSKNGAGVGIYIGDIRGRGTNISGNGKSEGVIPWLKCYDSTTVAVAQGCYDEHTEILTEKGWVLFKDLPKYGNIKVAQATTDQKIEFVNYSDYISYFTNEPLYNFYNTERSIDIAVTANHNMIIERRKRVSNRRDINGKFLNNEKYLTNKLELIRADLVKFHRDNRMFASFPINNVGKTTLTPLERLCIAYQADGATNPSGNSNGKISGTIIYNFHFSKQRKIDRLKNILDNVGYYYTVGEQSDCTTNIAVRFPVNKLPSKKLSDLFTLSDLTPHTAKEIIEEMALWDGSDSTLTGCSFVSIDGDNVDFMQSVAVLAGYSTNRKTIVNREGNRKDLHYLYVVTNCNTIGGENIISEKIPYSGYVYCVSVPSKMIVVRRNGRTLVCGNSTRRGASAVYLPIDHLDIQEFINVRRPTGDVNRRCLNLHHAVCISDNFMNEMLSGDKQKREIWTEVLKARFETGEPYLLFTDNVNNQAPECYKKNNLKIVTSNICNEIQLFTDPDHTFVCCISSLNVARYDEWKNTDAVKLSTWFLDGVMQEYIDKTGDLPGFGPARNFAIKSRALGLGVLGWHTLLQGKKIPFDSFQAMSLNAEIFKKIQLDSKIATQDLAKEYGEPEWCKGFGIRNSHTMAVAPTVSNSIISGDVSTGIEPIPANVFALKSAKGTFFKYNTMLSKLLDDKGKNTADIWKKINADDGSVQGLDFLSESEKEIFLTAREINQFAIIKQAAQRQKWIDQGQSVNLFFAKNSDPKYIHEVHVEAWRSGMKGLYYCRAESVLKGDSISRQSDECKACEG